MNPSAWSVFVDHLNLELRAVLQAPMIFIGGWLFGLTGIAVAIWGLVKWAYSERINSQAHRIRQLETEAAGYESKVRDLRADVERLTPPPLDFPLEKFTTPKELAEFVEGVRYRADDVAVRAKEWDKGFPGLQEQLRTIEMVAKGRAQGTYSLAEEFSPEENRVAWQFALESCENLHRTATELLRFLTTGRKQ
jgi:hypothetical protein